MLRQTLLITVRAAAPAILGGLGALAATALPVAHQAFCSGAF